MACGVEWRARVRTALKAEHSRSEQAPPFAVGVRASRGDRAGREGGRVCARERPRRGPRAAKRCWARRGAGERVAGAEVGRAGFGRGPSRLRPWAEKRGRRPAKEMKLFSF